uniref:Uncharacterized protein n=1 Tax=Opuntia streptacantha TaxID=393608 RepID=A0A7C9EY94_OPUST
MGDRRDKGHRSRDRVKDGSSSSSSGTHTPISGTPRQHSASSSAMTPSRPSGAANQGTHNNIPIQPPTPDPYAARQEAREYSVVARGTMIIGHNHNRNRKGIQKIGEVSICNKTAGSEFASPFPIHENIQAGYNVNEGDKQEIAGVNVGNIG